MWTPPVAQSGKPPPKQTEVPPPGPQGPPYQHPRGAGGRERARGDVAEWLQEQE